MAENQSLLRNNQEISPEEVLGEVFSGTIKINAIAGEVIQQVYDLCINSYDNINKRRDHLNKALEGDIVDDEYLIDVVSNLYLYGITGLDNFDGTTLEELTIEIRKGNYRYIEELLLSKMESVTQNNDGDELIKAVFEMADIIKGIVEMFGVLSANPQKKKYITKAVDDLEIFYLKFEKKLKESGINFQDLDLTNTLKEISTNITYAQVIYSSEIFFHGKDSIDDALNEYERKKLNIKKITELLRQNTVIEGESIISQSNIETYNKQITFLGGRLRLQYNQLLQDKYFETTSNNEESDSDITTLKGGKNIWLEVMFTEYDRLAQEKLGLNSEDLIRLRNNQDGEFIDNKVNNIEDRSNRKGKVHIQKILDHFIIQLKENNPDVILLFNIIECLLYQVDYIEKEVLDNFEEAINDELLSNKRFTPGDLNIYNILSSSAFKNKAMYLQKQKEAKVDGLTGLNNLVAFNEGVSKAIERSQRVKNTYMGIVEVDIDNFKEINDTYGHGFGDIVLSTFAYVLKHNTRPLTDDIYRVGGEEFFITFESNNRQEAIKFVEKIRNLIEVKVIELLQIQARNNMLKVDISKLKPITASLGFTEINGTNPTDNIENIIIKIRGEADEALYVSKATGRNRITEYDVTTTEELMLIRKKKKNKNKEV